MATIRTYLGGHRAKGRGDVIDMEEVYRMKDSGMTNQDVADKLGVSVRTLQNNHQRYQKKLMMLQNAGVDVANLKPHEVNARFAAEKGKSTGYISLPEKYKD